MAAATPTAIKGTSITQPTADPANHKIVLGQLKETTEIAQRQRGDPNDSFVRVSELLNVTGAKLINGTIQPPAATTTSGTGGTVSVQDSITGTGAAGSPLQLSGDNASPGNSMLYGTNSSGAKGWYAQPSSSGGAQASPDGVFVAPPSTGWTVFHSSSGATQSYAADVLTLNSLSGGSSPNTLYCQPLTSPASAANFDLQVFLTFDGSYNGGIPLVLYDSVLNNMQSYGLYGGGSNMNIYASLYLVGGVYSSTIWGPSVPVANVGFNNARTWHRVKRVTTGGTTTTSFYVSRDGVFWSLIASETSNLIPNANYIGFIFYNTTTPYGFNQNVLSWSLAA